MKKTWIAVLTFALLACAGLAPAFAEEPAPAQPAVSAEAPALCSPATVSPAAPAPTDLFLPKPTPAAPPVCNPFCINGSCTKSSQCTAQPNGRCVLACPQRGCCVYD